MAYAGFVKLPSSRLSNQVKLKPLFLDPSPAGLREWVDTPDVVGPQLPSSWTLAMGGLHLALSCTKVSNFYPLASRLWNYKSQTCCRILGAVIQRTSNFCFGCLFLPEVLGSLPGWIFHLQPCGCDSWLIPICAEDGEAECWPRVGRED